MNEFAYGMEKPDSRVADFDELLPAIRRSIAECDLIAFDTEFSGLGRRSNQLDYYDTPSVAYAKIREVDLLID